MYDLFDIVLTEVKKEQIEYSINQNLVQQKSSLEYISGLLVDKNLNGKRYRDEYEDIYKEISTLETYGLVTNGRVWLFTKLFYHNNAWCWSRSKEIFINFDHRLKDDTKIILELITSLILNQIKNIDSNNKLVKYKSHDPSSFFDDEIKHAITLIEDIDDNHDNDNDI